MVRVKLIHIAMLLLTTLLFSGCITDPGRGGHEAVVDFTQLANDTNTEDDSTVAVPVEEVVRPDRQVFIQRDYCACKSGKAVILNDCDSYCASAPQTTQPTLHVRVALGAEIELNSELGDLYNWCYKEIEDGFFSPSCSLKLYDGQTTKYLDIQDLTPGSKMFSVNINSLPQNVTYVATLVEGSSGSDASSDEFQIRMIEPPSTDTPVSGPLQIMPVSQYSCINRRGIPDSEPYDYEGMVRLHYYYAENNLPPPLSPGELNGLWKYLFCHDVNTYGDIDGPLYPRLENQPRNFMLWNQSDPRFVDADASTIIDVHELIERRLLDEYNVTSTINLFSSFTWANRPTTDSSTSLPRHGYFMTPWVDSQTNRAFCPTQEHYNGNQPIFRVLKELIGVDTEAIYLAEREPLVIIDSSGAVHNYPNDVMVIRETILKEIWFYYENGQHYVPDEVTASTKTIMFYYPPDTTNPYVRKSDQRIYTIKYHFYIHEYV